MKRKLLTLALILSLLVGMVLPTVAMDEVAASLIQNGGFETVDKENDTIAVDWGASSGGVVMTENGAHSGDRYLYIPFGESQITPKVALEPETHYMLRFQARTTVKDGSYVEIRFKKDDSNYTYISGEDTYFEWFGIENAVPTESETVSKLPWQEFSFAFTTPKHTNGATISICSNVGPGEDGNRNTAGDNENENYFCLDDVSLVATGREPNLLRNGYMTAFKVAGKHPSGWTGDTPVTGSSDYDVQYITNPNGEVTARFHDYSSEVATKYYNYKEKVYLSPGRYKLSFDFFRNTSSSNNWDLPQVYLETIINPQYHVQDILADSKVNTYEYYFTITKPFGYEFRVFPGKAANTDNTYTELSNIRIWKDETSVQYGKTKEGEMLAHGDLAWRDNMLHVTKISEADKNAAGTAYVVLPKGHYVPKSSDEESFTMVNALYRKYNNGNIVLENVKLTGGAASGGIVSNVNDSIEVPVLADGAEYTYEVHSFLLSGMDTLQAMNEKTILTY